MEYSDGVRSYILEWSYDVFLKAFAEKENPDSKINSKGDELKEDRIALTSQDIIKKHKEVHNETLTSKQYIISKIEPIIKYYSENGYFIKIKNDLDEEISLEELAGHYFGNVNDFFELEIRGNNTDENQ